MALDAKILEILVDPLTKAPLLYDRDHAELISIESALAYPVRDDIPVMIEEEARKLSVDEVDAWRKRKG
ncbi:MAG: Trm112 family protein [Betaproteobacteria bacterium]|nr:Trm112 family protein [Betaproteobacteria bacterium]MBL8535472.1 Trm112 family protein [Betaproteobacteria bacterium]